MTCYKDPLSGKSNGVIPNNTILTLTEKVGLLQLVSVKTLSTQQGLFLSVFTRVRDR
jgi:hypothetical protein